MHYNWKTEHALKRAIPVQFLQIVITIIVTLFWQFSGFMSRYVVGILHFNAVNDDI